MAQASAGSVFGRDREIKEIWRALGAVGGDAGRVIITGPAGIGKTTVWRAVVDRARSSAWVTLSCGPTEAEAELAFTALADLLEPVGDAIAALPAPQRAGLEGALLMRECRQVDERAVGAATRGVLAHVLARSAHPVVVAIDDAQWLDPSSERALRFALRRLPDLPVLISTRSGPGPRTDPLKISATWGAPTHASIELEPLGVGALHHIISRSRVGATLGRPLLVRLHRETGGNPLHAIELARAVARLPRLPAPTDDLPGTSRSGRDLVLATLESLPPTTRRALEVAAQLAAPRPEQLGALGIPVTALEPAEDAGLVVLGAEEIRFVHPTYASTVRGSLPAARARWLHRRLADTATDPDERARHLAHCVLSPDAAVAAELEAAAGRQRARGAPTPAADLYQRSAAATPAGEEVDRARRLLGAARCHLDSGDHPATSTTPAAVASSARPAATSTAAITARRMRWPRRCRTGRAASSAARPCCCEPRWPGPRIARRRRPAPWPRRPWRPYRATRPWPGASLPTSPCSGITLRWPPATPPERWSCCPTAPPTVSCWPPRSSCSTTTRSGPAAGLYPGCWNGDWPSRPASQDGWQARCLPSGGRASTTTTGRGTGCAPCWRWPAPMVTSRGSSNCLPTSESASCSPAAGMTPTATCPPPWSWARTSSARRGSPVSWRPVEASWPKPAPSPTGAWTGQSR